MPQPNQDPRTTRVSERSQRPGSQRLGKSAQRLLAGLAADPSRAPAGTRHSAADAQTLVAEDLAAHRPDGTLAITAAGRAHLARLELARSGAIDPFLGQHVDLAQVSIDTAQGRTAMAVDAAESPLAWLARRKGRDGRALIEPEHLQAGERLRADFTRAQMMPRTTANWTSAIGPDRPSGPSPITFTDVAIAARQGVRHALDAAGPEFTGLLLDVCCFLKGIEDVERERGWPPRSAKVVLQLGLGRLARHYGYSSEARGKAHVALRAWVADEAALPATD